MNQYSKATCWRAGVISTSNCCSFAFIGVTLFSYAFQYTSSFSRIATLMSLNLLSDLLLL